MKKHTPILSLAWLLGLLALASRFPRNPWVAFGLLAWFVRMKQEVQR
jgi:hypothetical protein